MSLISNEGRAHEQPFVIVSVGDKTKQTEIGDWSSEQGAWSFREVLTLEVSEDLEACIAVQCHNRYDFVVAAVSLASYTVGEACFPLASLLSRLRMEDRDIDGIMYTTPSTAFDLFKDGAKVGRAHVSFETKQPPPNHKPSGGDDAWCGNGLSARGSPVEQSVVVAPCPGRPEPERVSGRDPAALPGEDRWGMAYR